MAYWLDEGWHGWASIDKVGTAAAGLYARCGAYIADQLTDGFIPTERARMYGTPEWIGRLVESGLWTVEEHGFRDTRYLELNPSKADVDRRKQQAADRQQRYRDAHGSKPKTRKPRDSNALRDAQLTRTPTSPKGEGEAGIRHTPDLDPVSKVCRICDFPAAAGRHLRAV